MKFQEIQSVNIEPIDSIYGSVYIPGDKVATVHTALAIPFVDRPVTLNNVQHCGDVKTIFNWLEAHGLVELDYAGNTVQSMAQPNQESIDLSELSHTRSNICLATPLALSGRNVTFKGTAGCGFTERGVDKHFDLMKAFGLQIDQENELYMIKRSTDIKKSVDFDCSTNSGIPSVGVTCHALIASLVYKGQINLINTALEAAPLSLIEFITKTTNRKIDRNGRSIEIHAVDEVVNQTAELDMTPDFTVAATYLSALLAAKQGEITLHGMSTEHIPKSALTLYNSIGYDISEEQNNSISARLVGKLVMPELIKCDVWPAVPSDIAPMLAASLAGLSGSTVFEDNIYSSRSTHVQGLNAMGYDLYTSGNIVQVSGKRPQSKTTVTVEALDIRAGAALIVGAIGSNAQTITIDKFSQVTRGYADIVDGLTELGAKIKRNY